MVDFAVKVEVENAFVLGRFDLQKRWVLLLDQGHDAEMVPSVYGSEDGGGRGASVRLRHRRSLPSGMRRCLAPQAIGVMLGY